jgi:hypothetical protein
MYLDMASALMVLEFCCRIAVRVSILGDLNIDIDIDFAALIALSPLMHLTQYDKNNITANDKMIERVNEPAA